MNLLDSSENQKDVSINNDDPGYVTFFPQDSN
jgi:hypothetical protein